MNKKQILIILISTAILLLSTNFMTYFYLNHKFNLKLKYQRYHTLETIQVLQNSKKQITCEMVKDYLGIEEFECKSL